MAGELMSEPRTCALAVDGRPCAGMIDEDGYCARCGHKYVEHPGTGLTRGTQTTTRSERMSDLVVLPSVTSQDPRRALMANTAGARLKKGDLVAGQYLVEGCIAHGGLGWIYLARDRNLDDSWVVLKGLLDDSDPIASEAAISERRFLIEVRHPNIVHILNFVRQDDYGYIVMEYLPGKTLRELRTRVGKHLVLPVDQAIGFMLAVLPAFEYLHDIGLLYCDFKPDNVINSNVVKLIDLGAVCRIGSATPNFGTRGYQAPEVPEAGPSICSDLYTLARTVAVLCTDFDRRTAENEHRLPGPDEIPLFRQYDSLYRFLLRGSAPDPADRFQSAAEMRSQLALILHEVVSANGNTRHPHSDQFTDEDRAATIRVDVDCLPRLRLLAGDADQPDAMAATFAAANVLLEKGEVFEAEKLCATIEAARRREWRVSWIRGIAAMKRGDPEAARAAFERVYECVPGELAPKLAIGFAAEECGDLPAAITYYDTVSRTSPDLTSAAFGLARCAAQLADRDRAIRAYQRVPRSAHTGVEARVARARLLITEGDGYHPSFDSLADASVTAEDDHVGSAVQAGLRRDIFDQALRLLQSGAVDPQPGSQLLGRPMTESEIRLGLEGAYRLLASQAVNQDQRNDLVDRANHVRPRTWT